MNIYLAQFKQGFKYTFIYMLRDAGGSDSGYGIFEGDYRPKKSAACLHNLTTILSALVKPKWDRGPTCW